MPFHPTGPSARVTVASQTPAIISLDGLPEGGKVIRLVALTYPSKATCFVALGTSNVSLTTANGMPLDVDGKEQFLSVGDETHLAILMANSANYELVMTPGEII